MEREGRLFGSMHELENDVLRYQERMSVAQLLGVMKPHLTMDFGTHKVQWVLIESHKDFQKIMGIEFSQMMFDVSFPHDCLSYCLSRLRSPSRSAHESSN
jgi:hypothetical protein